MAATRSPRRWFLKFSGNDDLYSVELFQSFFRGTDLFEIIVGPNARTIIVTATFVAIPLFGSRNMGDAPAFKLEAEDAQDLDILAVEFFQPVYGFVHRNWHSLASYFCCDLLPFSN